MRFKIRTVFFVLFIFFCVNLKAQKDPAFQQAKKIWQLSNFSEFAIKRHYNFNFLPDEWLFFAGIGVNKDLVGSGSEFAFGLSSEIKFSYGINSNFYSLAVPLYSFVRLGNINFDHIKPLSLRAGVGLEYNNVFGESTTLKTIYMIELQANLGRPIYIRYSRVFNNSDYIKRGFQAGVIFTF